MYTEWQMEPSSGSGKPAPAGAPQGLAGYMTGRPAEDRITDWPVPGFRPRITGSPVIQPLATDDETVAA